MLRDKARNLLQHVDGMDRLAQQRKVETGFVGSCQVVRSGMTGKQQHIAITQQRPNRNGKFNTIHPGHRHVADDERRLTDCASRKAVVPS